MKAEPVIDSPRREAARKRLAEMKSLSRRLPGLLKETANEWSNDNAMRLAAALAYYTVFSLAPLMLAAISISGLVFGDEAASGKIYTELNHAAGPTIAAAVQEMVQAADKPVAGIGGALLGFALGLFGASGVFGELMGSLNQIWGVKAREGNGIWIWIRGRFLSIGMVMGVCFLLLVSLLANAMLGAAMGYGLSHLPGVALLGQLLTFVLSFAFVTALFAAMFKFLPDTRIEWRDVWTGAAVTAFLFTLGKFALEQYLARASVASGYGAAGTLAVLLVWVYYSAQIFLFGAEFTEVYSRHLGSRTAEPAPSEVMAAPAGPAVQPDVSQQSLTGAVNGWHSGKGRPSDPEMGAKAGELEPRLSVVPVATTIALAVVAGLFTRDRK